MVQLSLHDYMSEKGILKWFAAMTRSAATLPVQNVKTSLKFFAQHMPTLPTSMALNFLLAMDLSKKVQAITLTPGSKVIAFRTQTESPFKLFYTRPGASKHNSGINDAGRSIARFDVRIPTPALESYTTGAKDVWSAPARGQIISFAPRGQSFGVMAIGGGIQLLIPQSYSYLTYINPPGKP